MRMSTVRVEKFVKLTMLLVSAKITDWCYCYVH